MANFVTEDDKRIFDLQPIGTGESISDYQLVLDKTGNSEAKRITIPNFINRLFPNCFTNLVLAALSVLSESDRKGTLIPFMNVASPLNCNTPSTVLPNLMFRNKNF